jgi:hypothetical protein
MTPNLCDESQQKQEAVYQAPYDRPTAVPSEQVHSYDMFVESEPASGQAYMALRQAFTWW